MGGWEVFIYSSGWMICCSKVIMEVYVSVLVVFLFVIFDFGKNNLVV